MAQLNTAPGDGGLAVSVDAFGAFGSSVGGIAGDAFYDPVGDIVEAGTTFESGLALRFGTTGTRTFLTSGDISGSGGLDDPGFGATSPTSAASSFSFQGLDFSLTQTVADLLEEDVRTGSRLTQIYEIANPGTETLSFELIRYLDGDLLFDGSLIDGGGFLTADGQEVLFETDTAGEATESTTFVGITSEGGDLPAVGRFEVDAFPILVGEIISGADPNDDFDDGGLDPDPDDNGFVDAGAGFDITLAFRNLFTLAPGETATYTTTTSFGNAAPETIGDITATIAGTDGDDTLTGTGFGEILNAGLGNDAISPGPGSDVVDAGPGDDTIFADGLSPAFDQIDGGDGIDTAVFDGNADDFAIAIAGDVTEVGPPSEPIPDDLGTILYSGSFPGFASLAAGGDSDPIAVATLEAGFASDALTNVELLAFDDTTLAVADLAAAEPEIAAAGSISGDLLPAKGAPDEGAGLTFSSSNDDVLYGGTGGNRIYGGEGDDTFYAGSGDRLLGGTGSDTFYADRGTENIISGGAGGDVFVLADGSPAGSDARNTVTDFERGSDLLAIGGLGAADFADDITVTPADNGALVSFQGMPVVLLLGVAAESLSAADFIFTA